MLRRVLPTTRISVRSRPYNLWSLNNLCTSANNEGKSFQSFKVDRSALYNPDISLDTNKDQCNKEDPSPLTKDLQSYIKLRGPITIHDYMSQALNHGIHGYYQHKLQKIGTEGDFITSPEISQLFGEMIGIWCFSVWDALGRPSRISLVELGPGKGTLMKDVLRVSEKFPAFRDALEVHLVELSQTMRRQQHSAIVGGELTPHNHSVDNKGSGAAAEGILDGDKFISGTGPSVYWHSFLHQVPDEESVPFIAIGLYSSIYLFLRLISDGAPVSHLTGQEFLDAFPVHQFSYTKRGWRERLIDIDESGSSPLHFRVVIAPNTTPAVATLLSNKIQTIQEALLNKKSEAQRNASKLIIPSTDKNINLTEASLKERQQQLEAMRSALSKEAESSEGSFHHVGAPFQEGDGLEVSPLVIGVCEEIAKRVVQRGGAGLLVDYGEDFTQEDSLRAFKKHTQVHILSEPGRVDVTADVDFAICRRAAANKGATVLPLSTQGDFLMRMGIVERVEQLIDAPSTTEEQGEVLVASLSRLVDPAEMGRKYKVMAITSPGLQVHGFDHSASDSNASSPAATDKTD